MSCINARGKGGEKRRTKQERGSIGISMGTLRGFYPSREEQRKTEKRMKCVRTEELKGEEK